MELLIVLAIVLLLVGARKLPDLARGMGRARHEFEAAKADEPAPDVDRRG